MHLHSEVRVELGLYIKLSLGLYRRDVKDISAYNVQGASPINVGYLKSLLENKLCCTLR